MLKQLAIIDVAGWERDAEFAVFPQGARAKEALFTPRAVPDPVLTAEKRYLFKRSKKSYPDQFWGEVVAYRIGTLLGVEVPPAFAAWDSSTGVAAALIEWFYLDGDEECQLAGDLLTKMRPDFDRERGTDHNLIDNERLLNVFSTAGILSEQAWKQWWVDALLFDALIGNTDRHQDNWGVLFKTRRDVYLPPRQRVRLSPLFDNGTSLGHERFTERVASWSPDRIRRYIAGGTHQVSWSLEKPRVRRHMDLLRHALKQWPETRASIQARQLFLSPDMIREAIEDLAQLECAIPLTADRLAWMCRLMQYRLELIREII